MKPSYSKEKQNAPVTTRADLATDLGAQSLIRTMQRRAIPFGRERTKHITSHSLGPLGREQSTPIHLFSEQEVKNDCGYYY